MTTEAPEVGENVVFSASAPAVADTKADPKEKTEPSKSIEDKLDDLVIFFVSLSNHPSEKISTSAHEFARTPAAPYTLEEVVEVFGSYDEMIYKAQQVMADLPSDFQYTEQADLIASGEDRSVAEVKAAKFGALSNLNRQIAQFEAEISNLEAQAIVTAEAIDFASEELTRLDEEVGIVEDHFAAKVEEAQEVSEVARAKQSQALKGRASRNAKILANK